MHLVGYLYEALSTLVSTAYTSFNIKKLYTLPTHYIYKFSFVTNSTDSTSSTLQSLVVTILPPGLTFKILRSVHRAHFMFIFGSQNKQRLFFHTSLNNCFYNSDSVCLLGGASRIHKYCTKRYSSSLEVLI